MNAQCDFRAAARFEDELTVELRIARLGEKSVTYQFVIRHGEELVAEGKITAVCCRLSTTGGPMTPIPIPPAIAEKFRPFCASSHVARQTVHCESWKLAHPGWPRLSETRKRLSNRENPFAEHDLQHNRPLTCIPPSNDLASRRCRC